jgi:hypothetical protein
MSPEEILTDSLPAWPPDKTATRDLKEDFSRTILQVKNVAIGWGLNVDCLIMSALTPVSRNVFNWDAAERRADWEQSHGRFVEFGDVKGLLSDLHS